MKKLMILGAGIYQVPLIQKAKDMGLYTIAVSIPGPYPGFACADEVCYLDTRDQEAVLAAAKEKKIAGICTSGTDVAVRTIGFVCNALHLPGIPAAAAITVTDKWRMKEAFAKGGVSTARFHKVTSLTEALSTARGIGYPICLKAVDKSGSRGIRKVSDPFEMKHAWELCMAATDQNYLLVEEYLQAEEIGVDGFVQNHRLSLCVPHQKFVCRSGAVCIPSGHRFPYSCSRELFLEIRHQIELAVAAVGIDNCPFNADLFVRNNQVWIIEIGGRSGATCIPELMSIHCGFDYYEKMILSALGEAPSFDCQSLTPCMAKLLFCPEGGRLTDINPLPLEQLKHEGVQYHLDYSIGDCLPAVTNGTDRVGHVIAATDQESEIDRALRLLNQSLVLESSPQA
ncbi:MAG: ATP-grasp domain-containing protein [Fusicatenibacter sp.]